MPRRRESPDKPTGTSNEASLRGTQLSAHSRVYSSGMSRTRKARPASARRCTKSYDQTRFRRASHGHTYEPSRSHTPRAAAAEVHARMPIILPPDAWNPRLRAPRFGSPLAGARRGREDGHGSGVPAGAVPGTCLPAAGRIRRAARPRSGTSQSGRQPLPPRSRCQQHKRRFRTDPEVGRRKPWRQAMIPVVDSAADTNINPCSRRPHGLLESAFRTSEAWVTADPQASGRLEWQTVVVAGHTARRTIHRLRDSGDPGELVVHESSGRRRRRTLPLGLRLTNPSRKLEAPLANTLLAWTLATRGEKPVEPENSGQGLSPNSRFRPEDS